MVRFADILRNNKKDAKPQAEAANQASSVPLPEDRVTLKDCAKLYEEALDLAKNIFREDFNPASIDIKHITAEVEKLIQALEKDTQDLLTLAYIRDSYLSDKNYLLAHSLNTCIYSLILGLALGYDRTQLMELGLASFLHDLGLVRHTGLINKPTQMTTEERNIIKNHPNEGEEILRSLRQDLPKAVFEALLQHHERIDGTGYPKGLHRETINQYAKIISLVDVYEAMTHCRSFREEHVPFDVMKHILENKASFEYKLMKILIERIGIFPVGSLVELSNKEIAEVIRVNPEAPIRPVVRLIYSSEGIVPKANVTIDLSKETSFSIKRGIKRRGTN